MQDKKGKGKAEDGSGSEDERALELLLDLLGGTLCRRSSSHMEQVSGDGCVLCDVKEAPALQLTIAGRHPLPLVQQPPGPGAHLWSTRWLQCDWSV